MSERSACSTARLLSVFLLLILALAPRAEAGPCGATPHESWKFQLQYANFSHDQFTRWPPSSGEAGWVKFAILACDPTRVYFQNGHTYAFHYDFASQRLAPFVGMSRPAFDAATLHIAGQQAVLGAVLIPPTDLYSTPEFGIQFVGQDEYPRERIRDLFNLVKSKVTSERPATFYYMPTFEQGGVASEHAEWFQSQNVPVSSTGRWITGDRTYSKGWALGTLKYFPASEVQEAYHAGHLTASDILFTDAIPAELPYVAGIVSLAPATPNSHVAILAETYNIPFVHAASPGLVSRLNAAVGRRVLLRANVHYSMPTIDVTDTTGHLTPQQLADVMSLKATSPLAIQPIQQRGAWHLNTDALTPADTKYVGGKAANYGLLRRAIPNYARPAAGITFDVWNAFMDQTLTNGRTLREEIQLKLGGYTWPITNPAQLALDLEYVQALIKDTQRTTFSPQLQAAVFAALQDPAFGLDPNVKIRFRSSTNVEDTANFTGAGLYESFSGCLADDLDSNTTGPSICDPEEANERGVFRAIRRVYASFYYENAFAARRRLGVNEAQVGMGLLVHHSYPDPTELANGVVILDRSGGSVDVSITTQPGATSVTNPPPGVVPEEVGVYRSGGNLYPSLTRASNLVQLGDTVMDWDEDYRQLAQLCIAVADRYAQETGNSTFSLDFEFKKTTVSNGLEIKQVRPLPRPSTTPSITPYLMPLPVRWETFQGESSDIFAVHRMKASLTMKPHGGFLTQQALQNGFFNTAIVNWRANCWDLTLAQPLATFPGYTHTFQNGESADSWRFPGVPNPARHTIRIDQFPTLVAPSDIPVLLATDFGSQIGFNSSVFLEAQYAQAVPALNWMGQIEMRTQETVALANPHRIEPVAPPVVRTMGDQGIAIETRFFWPRPPGGIVAGYTAPLAAWDQTTITGLTTLTIILRDVRAQTYRPGHHNFTEDFIFDPRFEPMLTAHQRRQLRDRGVGYLYARWGTLQERTIFTYPSECAHEFCPADLDGPAGNDVPDGAVEISDLLRFLTFFEAGDIRADLDDGGGNGSLDEAVDVSDLLHFLVHFEAGC